MQTELVELITSAKTVSKLHLGDLTKLALWIIGAVRHTTK